MSRLRPILKWGAKVLAVLVALLVVAYVVISIVGRRALVRELERVKASGAPTSWEEVIPPPVPDEQNAAALYEDAFALLDFTGGVPPPPYPPDPAQRETGPRKTLSDYLAAARREERKALEKDIRKLLAENADALSYARQAAKRPKCRFDRDWSNPVTMAQREMPRLQDLSRLASAQAMLRAGSGDLGGALEAWDLTLAIVKDLEPEPELLGQLMRYAVLHIAGTSLHQILQEARPSPEQCRSLAQALGEVELGEAFVRSLQAQRTIHLWMLAQARKRPEGLGGIGMRVSNAPDAGQRRGAVARRFAIWLGYRAVGPFDQAAMLRFWDKQIAVARKPYREGMSEFATLTQDIPRYALITRLWAPVFARASCARDRAIAQVGLMRTALGLSAYRTRYGRYPESLDQLRQVLEWQVPQDPFSGKDLVYRREGKGYVLYSLDRDLDDDGGEPLARDQAAPTGISGDTVWEQER